MRVGGPGRCARFAFWRTTVGVSALLTATPVTGSAQAPSPQAVTVQPTQTPRQVQTNPMAPPPGQDGFGLTLSVAEGYDRNNLDGSVADDSSNSTPIYRQTGFYTTGSVGTDYARGWTAGRALFSIGANAKASAFSSSDRVVLRASQASNLSIPLGTRTTFSAAQTLAFAPYYNFGLFPGIDPEAAFGGALGESDPTLDFAVQPVRTYRYGVIAGLSHTLSKRSSISFSYDRNYTDFRGARPNHSYDHANAGFSRRFTRDLGVHIGYGYGTGRTFDGNELRTNNINAGIDYSKALSFSRRTTFTFSTGSSILAGQQTTSGTRLDRRYNITGNARLNHEIGRSWAARLSYQRGWQFIDVFSAPFFSDSITVGLGGLIGARARLATSLSYASGQVGLSNVGGGNGSYRAATTFRFKTTQRSSLYAQYLYYQYAFSSLAGLSSDFPSSLERHGARAGFTLYLPIFR